MMMPFSLSTVYQLTKFLLWQQNRDGTRGSSLVFWQLESLGNSRKSCLCMTPTISQQLFWGVRLRVGERERTDCIASGFLQNTKQKERLL